MELAFPKDIVSAVSALLHSRSIGELQEALKRNSSILLKPTSRECLIEIIQQLRASGSEAQIQHAEFILKVLESVCKSGIDSAFEQIRTEAETLDAVMQLCRASSIQTFEGIVSKYAHLLLSDGAVLLMKRLLANEKDERNRFVLRHRLGIVERAKREGITAAMHWEKQAELFRQVMNTKTQKEAEDLVASEIGAFTTEAMGNVVEEIDVRRRR